MQTDWNSLTRISSKLQPAQPNTSMLRLLHILLMLFAMLATSPLATAEPPPAGVRVVRIDGIIGPATASFVAQQLDAAKASGDRLLVLRMDTPGGLDSAMREIIRGILASPVPVATFVHPEGARAASAGTYILYASHIAAMAPATNLGAATPVAIGISPGGGEGGPRPGADTKDEPAEKGTSKPVAGSTMERKAVNDATAYLRSLAELRGRDLEFAEQAVLEAASLSATQALAAGVIDLIAEDLPSLLAQLDGREVEVLGKTVTLATADADIHLVEADLKHRLLGALANPQLAVVLMMIGVYGLFFEFTSPGFGVPGVAGAICLLIALYAFHMLPVNWVGVALIGFGAALMLAEAFLPSFGALGVGGLVAFVLGGLFLIDSQVPAFGLSIPFLFGMALLSALTLFAIGSFAARAHRRPLASGREIMAGAGGRITTIDADGAWATVDGESWRVDCAAPLEVGDAIQVEAVHGLTLQVRPCAENSEQPRS